MNDYFELDFLDVETKKSGDAIGIRYQIGTAWYVHVVDGGYQQTGPAIEKLVRESYGTGYVNNVVLTHPDGDHAGGLQTVLENLQVGALWMLRPWEYSALLMSYFPRIGSVDYLHRALREAYPTIVALEDIAIRKKIPIYAPLQGAAIGPFTVLAPSLPRYLSLIARSSRTPPSTEKQSPQSISEALRLLLGKTISLAKSAWGVETFSAEGVSPENEMSVVQFGRIAGEKILLTADAGREALAEAIAHAPHAKLDLPGIDRFQVPHHGSRRNVTTQLLDQLVGPRLTVRPALPLFKAIISSAKADPDHPRKAIVRAMIHRGANVTNTEGADLRHASMHAPPRAGYSAAFGMEYPDDEERD